MKKRVSFNISAELYKQLKIECIKKDIKIDQAIHSLVHEFVKPPKSRKQIINECQGKEQADTQEDKEIWNEIEMETKQ